MIHCLMKNLEEFLTERYTDGSAQRYLYTIRKFLESIGESRAREAKHTDIIDYLHELKEKGHSNEYIATDLYAIRSYYHWLIHNHLRVDNPTSAIFLHNVNAKNVQFQNLFSETELDLLLKRQSRYELLRWRDKLAISLYIYQALTTGEIVALTIHDFDLAKGYVYIEGGRNSSRILPLQNNQLIFFEHYLTFDRPFLIKFPTERLLIGKLGQPTDGDGIQYLIESQKKLFPDRKLDPKTIRQSVIVNLFKKGMDIKDIQLFSGHKFPSSTEIYKPTDLLALLEGIGKFHPFEDF